MKVSSSAINAKTSNYGGYSMPSHYNTVAKTGVYKDNESDTYGRALVNRLRGLGAITFPSGFIPMGGGSMPSGGGSTSGASPTCTACPPNCTTTSQQTTYYAHKQKLSDTDIPVKVNLKRIRCEGNQGVPRPACEQNLIALKQSMGLNGLSGCSACSGGYANRM